MAITEGTYRGEFVQSLANGSLSIDNGTIKSGEDLVAGQVLGCELTATKAAGTNTGTGTIGTVTFGPDAQLGVYQLLCTGTGPGVASAGSGAAVAGNTGNGTITASPTTGANAKVGVYRITCIEPATDLGKFQVEDPDGIVIGVATVGTQFTTGSHLTFTIADGATDFVSGDSFTITVAAANSGTFSVTAPDGSHLNAATVGVAYSNSHLGFAISDATDFVVNDSFTISVTLGSWVALNFSDTDGGQIARGIAYDNYDATGGAIDGAIVVRLAEVNGDEITWPAGATSAQKAQAGVELARTGVVIR